MRRVQIQLDSKEMRVLKKESEKSGKSYSQLVREAIDNIYISRFSDAEIADMAGGARRSKGLRKFKSLQVARSYLWSL